MTDRMEEIGDRLEAAACVYPATIDGHAALFNAIGERDEHAADDLVFLWERCASLEALVRELAGALVKLDQHMDFSEPAGNGAAFYYEDATGINEAMAEAAAALTHPLVPELTGEKTEKCPICGGTGWGDPDMPEECATCCGTGEKEGVE